MTDQAHTDDTVVQIGQAAIYARQSTGARGSASPQTATLMAFANAQGYPDVRIALYEEVGVSAPDQAALFQSQREQANRYSASQVGKLTQRGRRRRRARQKPQGEQP